MSSLPPFAFWTQFAVTAIIAIVGACIAWAQLRVATIKVQYELYPDRLKVYQAAANFINSMIKGEAVDIPAFNKSVEDAQFLFDAQFAALLRDVHLHAAVLLSYVLVTEGPNRGPEYDLALDGQTSEYGWFLRALRQLEIEAKPFIQFPSPRNTATSRVIRFLRPIFSPFARVLDRVFGV